MAMRAAISVLLCGTLAACAGGAPPSPEPGTALIPVPTQSPPPPLELGPVACPAALLEGTLVAHEEVGMAVEGEFGRAPAIVVWPHGWAARDVDGVRELLDAEGRVVAREGDFVSAGGGSFPPNDWFHPCGEITFRAPR
jgi:hypothetical protein